MGPPERRPISWSPRADAPDDCGGRGGGGGAQDHLLAIMVVIASSPTVIAGVLYVLSASMAPGADESRHLALTVP